MRTNNRALIVFETGNEHYDPELGKMVEGISEKKLVPCFMSDLGLELKNELLDKLDVDAKVVRFNKNITGRIKQIEIDGRKYVPIDKKTFYKRRSAIHISEVLDGRG